MYSSLGIFLIGFTGLGSTPIFWGIKNGWMIYMPLI